MLVPLVVSAAICVPGFLVLVVRVVLREVRLFRAAKRARPAVLEGGGSHLSTMRRR